MSRSASDNALPPYAKQEIFKKAYDTINEFINSGNLIGAFVLSFSILEDRLAAAVVVCSKAKQSKLNVNNVSKMLFKQRVDHLLRIQSIDDFLYNELINAAYLRNELTHKMMWRIDVFEVAHVMKFRKLINKIQTVQRRHARQLATP